jgi:light-regulated signal transduction histidine kinase (bacteriophytochrome)
MPIQAPTVTDLYSRIGKPPEEDCTVCLNSASVHDLSSPVNQLCTLADLILVTYRDAFDDEAEFLFGFIQTAAARLQNLVAGLRTCLGVLESASPPRRCSLEDLLRGALASLEPKIRETGALVTHGYLPELDCDPNQITFVLTSLVDNAIKFRGKESPHIRIAADSAGDRWVISVCDNGLGIDPRHHQRVFDVFQRVHKDGYPGAGMGLAIARRIVERHQGTIRVESVPDEGTTVIIELPMQSIE